MEQMTLFDEHGNPGWHDYPETPGRIVFWEEPMGVPDHVFFAPSHPSIFDVPGGTHVHFTASLSINPMDAVKEFHYTYDIPVAEEPTLLELERRRLRWDLLDEELNELDEAEREGDLVEIADALADMVYIIYGTAAEYGIPLDRVFDEVHRSNMSKLGDDGEPIYREDGKVLKGPNYFPPEIRTVLGL